MIHPASPKPASQKNEKPSEDLPNASPEECRSQIAPPRRHLTPENNKITSRPSNIGFPRLWNEGLQSSLRQSALLIVLLALTPAAHPQGCAQCRDNTAATPPEVQAAYRHAILFMVTAASGLFLTTVYLLKRHR